METSDIISGVAAIVSCLAFWVAYKALKVAEQTRLNDKLQELRVSVSDMLSEANIIKIKYEKTQIDHASPEVIEVHALIDELLKHIEEMHLLMFGNPVGFDEKNTNNLLIKAKTLNDMLGSLKFRLEGKL